MYKYLIILILLLCFTIGYSQPSNLTAKEIIEIADEKVRGTYATAKLKMTIIRPDWSREMEMKSWSKEDDYSLILVTAPCQG